MFKSVCWEAPTFPLKLNVTCLTVGEAFHNTCSPVINIRSKSPGFKEKNYRKSGPSRRL